MSTAGSRVLKVSKEKGRTEVTIARFSEKQVRHIETYGGMDKMLTDASISRIEKIINRRRAKPTSTLISSKSISLFYHL